MGYFRHGAATAILQLSTLFCSCYGVVPAASKPSVSTSKTCVPATNSIQTSILSQQAYNLCLYEDSIGIQTASCTAFGSSRMTPVNTVITSGAATATFVASFLTEYGGLPCPGTTINTTDSNGAKTQLPVGELGQG
jgi:hypothetical protein